MRIAFVFLAVLGLTSASTYVLERRREPIRHVEPKSLDDLLQQLADMIPFDKCLIIYEDYAANNADVQQAIVFLQSDEFKQFVIKVDSMPEFQQFLQYLSDSGLDIYTYINIIHKIFGLPPVIPPRMTAHYMPRESGIILMVNDILAVLPMEEIKNWYLTVCKPDPAYQALLERIRAPEFQKLVETVKSSPEYTDMTNILKSQGIDVERIEKIIRDFFHGSQMTRQTKSLDDLLKQFAAFIPFDECLAIFEKYLANNDDVKNAVMFLESDEFQKLVEQVDAMPEYQEFLKYLSDSGLDIYTYINIIHKIFGLPPVIPPRFIAHHMPRESGIILMVREILDILPVDDIKNWFLTVCLPDPDFQALLDRIRAPEFQKLVETVKSSQQYLDLTNMLKAQGIDVEMIEKIIRDFFHGSQMTRQTKSLDDLLKQFAAFIPFDECLAIFEKYLANNDDVKNAVMFLESDEFQKLVEQVDAMPEYQEFLKYLSDSGLDIYTYINIIHKIFGLPPVIPPRFIAHHMPRESGIILMVREILDILPVDDIKNWFLTVCLPDPDFQALLDRIRAPEFQKLVETVKSSQQYLDLTNMLKAQGIDVEMIEKIIRDFFHGSQMTRQTKSLDDLLKQFAAFIPFDECLAIFEKYLANNDDVKNAVMFLESDEFQKLVEQVDAMPEYQEFLKYLSDSGLDIYTYINIIHKIFGLPPVIPPRFIAHHMPRESGIILMVREILDILPVDDIKNWFLTVCLPDPDFQALLDRIRAPEFQKLVETVKSSQQYLDLTNMLKAQGIDVEMIEKIIRDFFHGSQMTRQTKSLDDLLKQFAAFIPFDECLAIFEKYLANNDDVKNAVMFLESDEFQKLVEQVDAMPEYQEFLKYLSDSGLDIYTYINIIHKIFGLPPVIPPRFIAHHMPRESGIILMVREILDILPVDDIKNWFLTVCLPDPDFQALLDRIRAPEFQKLVETVKSSQQYLDLTNMLKAQGIDVEMIEKIIRDFFHGSQMTRQTKSLDDLLKQFAAFIPFDECLAIFEKYLANNDDVKNAVMFLESDEFQKLVEQVDAMPEYQEFLKYLSDSGLDIYTYINIIHKIFGLPPVIPPRFIAHHMPRESGIILMVREILDILPVDDIKNWFLTVCLPDPDFQALLDRIRAPEFQKLVETVKSSQQYLDLTNMLKAQGIDVEMIEKIIRDFFHGSQMTRQTKSLDDLLKQFAAFIPFDECLAIFEKYLANNDDVKNAVMFLESDEFQKLVEQVDAMPEYQEFLKYLSDSGLDIYTYINIIHKIFGLPPVIPPRFIAHHMPRESGIILMVREILDILPVDDIKNWFLTVCLPDPDFQALLDRIRAPEFQKLVETVKSSQQYLDLTNMLKAQGIDVEMIEKIIRDFFHGSQMTRQTKSLDDLLKQFAAFIPFDECLAIFEKYLANNDDVKNAVMFLESDEFQKLVEQVDAMPEYQEFLKYLSDSGLDIYTYINIIHKIFGLPPVIPPRFIAHHMPRESGIILMVREILDILPVDDIKNWFLTVCLPDPDFQALLDRIRAPEFQKLVETVKSSQQYLDLTNMLKAQGIDVEMIEKIIRDFFHGSF